MSEEKVSRRRIQTSYFSTIISISLVLFMLGLLGLILLNAKKLSDHVKENIGFSVILKETAKEVDVVKLQKSLDAAPFVKTTVYVDKDQAAEELQKELGEEFVDFLGYNPLLSSIDVNLNANYANPDSVAWIKEEIMADVKVKEIFYQESLVSMVNHNIKKITLILMAFSGLLMIIAIALINNSIRLTIYSKRFLIRTMQLVGATSGFIRRPFVWRGIRHGVISAFIAIGLLALLMYVLQNEIPELIELQDVELFASLLGLVTALGVLISWLSTSLAVRKFLRLRADQLY